MDGKVVCVQHRYDLCTYLESFNRAVLEWQRWKSQPMQRRVELVLHNLYDIEKGLRTEVYDRVSSCVRKPFVEAEADRCNVQSRLVERQFMVSTCLFGGHDMLSKMKEGFQACNMTDTPVATDVRYGAKTTALPGSVQLSQRKGEMERIIFNERSRSVISIEASHHEAVLDSGFHFKFPHMQRNDSCFDTMRHLVAAGFQANMREQLQGDTEHTPVYRNALLAIKYVREQLQELHIFLHKDKILAVLDDKKLNATLRDGSLTWPLAVRLFRTIIYAMRFCVGNDSSRAVLYEQRSRLCQDGGALRTVFDGSCSKEERYFSMRPAAYNRLLEEVAEASRGGSAFNLRALMCRKDGAKKQSHHTTTTLAATDATSDIPSQDNDKYALDETTYKQLMLMVQRIEHADSTNSASALVVVFCDTMQCIMEALDKLDVCLTNANIASTRLSTIEANVKKEQILVAPWFQQGLGMRNTLKWLRFHAGNGTKNKFVSASVKAATPNIMQLVYRGYISLLMDPNAQMIDEVDYPELLVLDIEYIQKTRGLFYGYVAQATVLVIIGQRLTEAGVSGKCIHSCIGRLVLDPAFILLGNADTCRAEPRVVDPLLSKCAKYLQEVLPAKTGSHVLQLILREVARETTTNGYPSSPIASSIAQKWITATLQACLETPCGMYVVHPAFSSPEATRAAFSSELLLPKAALYLSRDLHFYTLDIIKRTSFNVAVHSERYKKIACIL
jgi:hypothetical protein